MMIYYTNGEETLSERELLQRYRDDIDETNEEIKIGILTFVPSQILEEVDPIAFRVGFSDWQDAEGWEESDDEDENGEQGNETPSLLLSSEIGLYD